MTESNIDKSQVFEPTADEQARRIHLVYVGKRPFRMRPGDDPVMPGDELDDSHPYANRAATLLERADFEEI